MKRRSQGRDRKQSMLIRLLFHTHFPRLVVFPFLLSTCACFSLTHSLPPFIILTGKKKKKKKGIPLHGIHIFLLFSLFLLSICSTFLLPSLYFLSILVLCSFLSLFYSFPSSYSFFLYPYVPFLLFPSILLPPFSSLVLGGVPQGSVFCPVFFITYPYDIDEGLTCKISRFTKDMKIIGKLLLLPKKKTILQSYLGRLLE